MDHFYGGVEAGGTKFVCVIGNSPNEILAEERFSTTSPQETIQRTIKFFKTKKEELKIELTSIGLGCFGPIGLDKKSSDYGFITSTPKPGWKNTDIIGPLQKELKVPIIFDTDVNAAAIGEGKWGAGKNLSNFIYFTIGTGIGGGIIIDNQPVHGLIHPEIGHILISKNPLDQFTGKCPFHKNCFEGLASGPSIQERWNISAEELPPHHQAWDFETEYIAKALSIIICTISPQRIILGGGVMQQLHLFPKIQSKTIDYLNGYIQSALILENIEDYIVPPKLKNKAGMLGAIALAQSAGN
ncbi:MAG: ROK family protein [Anaerolineaceae bacterium]